MNASTSKILNEWADLYERLPRTLAPQVEWIDAATFSRTYVDSYLPAMCIAAREVLSESNELMRPLEDPFLTDFASNLQLANKREEVYSDWLAWILREISDLTQICKVFGLPDSRVCDYVGKPLRVRREYGVAHGHAGHTGRLDIVVVCGGDIVVVVEMKLISSREADTAKQIGYSKSLNAQSPTAIYKVLVANDRGESRASGNFQVIPLGRLCRGLRGLVAKLVRQERIVLSALILGFVGAVEQNLMGLSAQGLKPIYQGQSVPFEAKTIEYLKSTVEGA